MVYVMDAGLDAGIFGNFMIGSVRWLFPGSRIPFCRDIFRRLRRFLGFGFFRKTTTTTLV
jgi:hypothetical protein